MSIEQTLSTLNRRQLLEEFQYAPDSAWFAQDTVAAIRDCSLATIERYRWAGVGIPFIKSGRSVRYRKCDILAWLSSHKPVQSTTQAQAK